MALILAIEPDRRQAATLASSVQGRLDADVVLEASAEQALPRLAGRVPDLILTTALLSPKDDAALADWLRQLGTSAAHVQTLTIPVLGSASQRKPHKRGMLSALRRNRSVESNNGGCDPAVFVDQIASYLERAAAERAEVAELLELKGWHNDAAAATADDTESDVVLTADEPVADRPDADFDDLPLVAATDAVPPVELADALDVVAPDPVDLTTPNRGSRAVRVAGSRRDARRGGDGRRCRTGPGRRSRPRDPGAGSERVA